MLRYGIFAAAVGGLILADGAAAAQPTALHALPAEPYKYLSAKEVAALTDKPGPGSKSAIVSDHENYFVEYVARSDAGNLVEVHAHWIDYIHVLSGEGILSYGGSVADAKPSAPGEIRGGAILGGNTQALHAGDFVQIPPGTPHMISAAIGGKIGYIVFKGRQ